jgi:Uma2 family endonuclease
MSAVLDAPPAPKLTPDDLFSLPDRGKGLELVDGEVKELNVSYLSSYIAGRLYFALASYVASRLAGWVSPEGTSFRCFPDDRTRVRRADTAFHRLDRLTQEQAIEEGHCTVVPDLVVEVVSPNDLAGDVNRKRGEWLAAGAGLVWVAFPDTEEIHAYTRDGTVRIFGPADTLTADPVLPDFRTPVADLFRLPTSA